MVGTYWETGWRERQGDSQIVVRAATRRLPPIYLFQRGNEYFIYHRDLLVFVGLFENVEDSVKSEAMNSGDSPKRQQISLQAQPRASSENDLW